MARAISGARTRAERCGRAGALALAATLCGLTAPASATENGITNGPLGLPTFLSALMPPPGATQLFDYVVYAPFYDFAGNDGDALVPGFHSTALANGLRVVHTWDVDLGGFNVGSGFGVLAVYASNHADIAVPSPPAPPGTIAKLHDRSTGIANIVVQPVYVTKQVGDFHFLASTEVFIPVGDYDPVSLANVSTGYWTIGTSAGFTWLPTERFELSAMASVQFNFENSETEYTSGSVFNIDYGVNWAPPVSDIPFLWVGIGGNYAKQFTDDESDLIQVEDHGRRLQQFSIGPQATIMFAPNVAVQAKYQHLLATRNTAEGERFWLSFTMPLKM
jgi:hypothetical protein